MRSQVIKTQKKNKQENKKKKPKQCKASVLQTIKQPLALQRQHDLVNNGPHRLLGNVDRQVRFDGVLVGVVDSCEALDLAGAGALVDAALVRLLAVLERCVDPDEVEVAVLFHELPGVLPGGLKGCDRGGDDGRSGAGQLGCNKGDAANVLVAILAREAQLRRELTAHRLTEQH